MCSSDLVLGSGGGWLSRDEMVAHFGLGAATMVDSLRITWPDGRVSIRTGIAPGQVLTVVGPTPAAVPGEDPTDTPRLRAGLTAVAPNPFNPATRIRFATARPGPVDLAIYDVGGRLVRRLVAAEMAAGEHEAVWRGRDGRDRPVAAGVYFVRLAAADRHWTRAVTLVK